MELWTEMVMTMMIVLMTTMVIIKAEMLTMMIMRRIIPSHGTAGVHELYHGAMDCDSNDHDDDNDGDNQSRDADNDNNEAYYSLSWYSWGT